MDEAREILLREYVEAGLLLRQHELLTRTSASVFVPTLVALAGYVLGADSGLVTKAVLSAVGLVTSLLAGNVVRRHQLYYRRYLERAKVIEGQLKVRGNQIISLYSDAASIKDDSCTISSKTAFIIFFVFGALLFLISGVIFVYQQFSACVP